MPAAPSKATLIKADLRQMSHIWFGLRPFLSRTWSKRGYDDARMDLGFPIQLQFKLITLARWLWTNHDLFVKQEYALHERALRRLRSKLGDEGVGEARPLPEVSASVDPEEFRARFVEKPHPVVIRGLANELPAVQRWNKEFFIRECGDTLVQASSQNYHTENDHIEYKEFETSVREALSTPGVYLDVNRELFTNHPWLLNDIEGVHDWRRYLGRANCLVSQLFMGTRADGAPFHCASQWNIFVMIEGEKEWEFVSPEYTLQLGAIPHPTMIAVEARVTGKGESWRDNHLLYQRFCPRYKTVVRKGDVIVNPPWWWHEVKNNSHFSIGLSSRWLHEDFPHTNSLFDLAAYLCLDMWRIKMHLMENIGADAELPGGEDKVRRMFDRKQPKHKRYFHDFISRSENKLRSS